MKRLIILLLISLSSFACNQKSNRRNKVDKFYTDKGDFDLSRFPLIKPYEISTGHSLNWIISSVDDSEVLGTVPGTKNIDVVDSVIFAYSENTIINGQLADSGWFVIIPKNHLFRGFKTQFEYLTYLSSINVKAPKMYDVTEVFQYFDSKDTLDWKELNHKY